MWVVPVFACANTGESEGLPSGRTAEFIARARWTLEEALAEAERILPIYREERRVQVQRHRELDAKEGACP